jgi:hypothetical protein
MAMAGFFYYNKGDCVQCAFCLGILKQWERGDNPWAEHKRHFPRCPFILNLPVGNERSIAPTKLCCERHAIDMINKMIDNRRLDPMTN